MGVDRLGKLSPMGIAAVAFGQELQRFERLTELSRRIDLDSRKNLERASQAAAEAAQSHARLAEHMSALGAALETLRGKNEKIVENLNERRAEIAARTKEVRALVDRVGAMAQKANEISSGVKKIRDEAEHQGPSAGMLEELSALGDRMQRIIDETGALVAAAKELRVADLAGEIDSLRQQLAAAGNKLNLLERRLVAASRRPGA